MFVLKLSVIQMQLRMGWDAKKKFSTTTKNIAFSQVTLIKCKWYYLKKYKSFDIFFQPSKSILSLFLKDPKLFLYSTQYTEISTI